MCYDKPKYRFRSGGTERGIMNTMKLRLPALLLCLAMVFSLGACARELPDAGASSNTNPLSPDCTHRDQDDDGTCDSCKGNLLVELDFYAINDIHGKFNDSTSQPGVDELTTYLKSQGENTVLLSSGDTWQGSSESNLTHGALMVEWMNALGFASMTLGNHEFDWGAEYIRSNGELAEFPLLAINIYSRETGEPVEYCQPSVMVHRNGIDIGIIGAIGDCYTSISGDKTQDIYFRTGSQLTELVKAEATRLRQAGAEVIVYSIHDGIDRSPGSTASSQQLSGYYDTSLSNGYVDLVFEGHTHQRYVFTDEYGVYHLQAGGENSGIAHADLRYNLVTGTTAVTGDIIGSDIYGGSDPDPLIQQLLEKFADQIALGDRVVGTVGEYMSSDQITQLVAELYYHTGIDRWGDEYDIALAGALIGVRNPYHIPSGQIRYSQLQSILPFDNQIVLCSVKGRELISKFYETTNEKYGVYYEEYGQALRDNVDPNGTYYIITDTYTSSYAPNKLTVVASYDPGVYARDLLADYIAQGHLAPPASDDYTLTSIGEILAIGSRLEANGYSDEQYYVRGTVTKITQTTYGNMYIQDENGDVLYIYGVNGATGSLRYDQMPNPPQVGDTVILCGRIQNYHPQNGDPIIELVKTHLISK